MFARAAAHVPRLARRFSAPVPATPFLQAAGARELGTFAWSESGGLTGKRENPEGTKVPTARVGHSDLRT